MTKPNIIEKGSRLYWYFWHLTCEGGKNPADFLLLFILKCFVPVYYAVFVLHNLVRKAGPGSKKYPVISVGNLTLGGTGKSPCVEFISAKLLKRKKSVGILTSGYGRRGGGEGLDETGDEPLLFAKHLPETSVFVSRNKRKSFLDASKNNKCDVFVIDDGFQYPCINKDLEILLINKRNPFGNGNLFPAGPLRELPGSVKKADLVILTHSDEADEKMSGALDSVLSKGGYKSPVLESIHAPLYFRDAESGQKYEAGELKGRKLLALSSLADPLSFENSLKKLAVDAVKKVRFPDHYVYTGDDVKWLDYEAKKENADFIVTTEKDFVRFPKGCKISSQVLCLIMDFRIVKGEDILDKRINRVLEKYDIS